MEPPKIYELLHRIESFRPGVTVAAGALLLASVGVLDSFTGFEVRLAVLYYVPVALLAWRFPRRGFVWAAVVATGTWVGANLLGPAAPDSLSLWLWNTIAMLVPFLFVGLVLAQLRSRFDELLVMAVRDPLTGLLNRRGFEHALEREHTRARLLTRPLTLVYLDVDDFKAVNDALGHAAGDELLKLVADVLRHCTTGMDALGRLGGDEFAMLLPELPAQRAAAIAEAVLTGACKTSEDWGRAVTLSVGAATFDPVPARPEAVIRAADELMYEAKRNGKGRVAARLFAE